MNIFDMAPLIAWCARNGIDNEQEIASLIQIIERLALGRAKATPVSNYPDYKPLRNRKGLTQQEVADAVGTSKPMISYLENRQIVNPNKELLDRLNKFYSLKPTNMKHPDDLR